MYCVDIQTSNFVKAGLPVYGKVRTYHNFSFINCSETDKSKIFSMHDSSECQGRKGLRYQMENTCATHLNPEEVQVLGSFHVNKSIIIAIYLLLHIKQKKYK